MSSSPRTPPTRKPRILLVAPDHPFEPTYGLGQRINLLWRALQNVGTVEALVVQEAHIGGQPPEVEGMLGVLGWDTTKFTLRNRYAADPALAAWQREHVQRRGPDRAYDVVISQHLTPLMRLGGPRVWGGARTILDFDDADHLVQRGGAGASALRRLARDLKRRVQVAKVRQAARGFDHVWFTSPNDERATSFCTGTVLPNIPYDPPAPAELTPVPDSKRILWVGALDYGPNYEGLSKFVRESWPAVRAAVPDAEFRVAGRCSPERKREFTSMQGAAGVSILGFADDLPGEYQDCRFAIAPIHRGGGTNIKVVEAYARGRACVVTPFSYYGYEDFLKERESVLVGRTSAELAAHCVSLLQDHSLAAGLAEHGLRTVQRTHSFARFEELVAQSVTALLA